MLPEPQGLYDPHYEHDSCGVGFVANISGEKSHDIIRHGLQIMVNLEHRGAVGADPLAGDGAGILVQTPHAMFKAACEANGIALPEPEHYGMSKPRGRRCSVGAMFRSTTRC